MPGHTKIEPMLEIFCFETNQYLTELEQSMISSEKSEFIDDNTINEIFRIMHNIKSSSAMMLFNNIAVLAHKIEDLFFFIREQNPPEADCSVLSDLVLDAVDFIKVELEKIKNGDSPDGDNALMLDNIQRVLEGLEKTFAPDILLSRENSRGKPKQQYYLSKDIKAVSLRSNFFKAVVYFQDGCEMENVRAYAIVHHIKEIAQDIYYTPADIIENDDTALMIRESGFEISFKSDREHHEIQKFFNNTAFVRDLELVQLHNEKDLKEFGQGREVLDINAVRIPVLDEEKLKVDNGVFDQTLHKSNRQSIISVSVNKLDMLMDLVGEMVTAEAMVTQNPDLLNLELDNFRKAARQLRKITSEVQDIVMSIRMVPLDTVCVN